MRFSSCILLLTILKWLSVTDRFYKIYLDKQLALPKIGAVKVKVHRQAPNQKPLKTTIVRTAAGEYYVSFLYVCPERNSHIFLPITQELTLGLDFSVPKFYVDSDGNSPDHPHFQEEALPQIKLMRAAMSRKQKGSANYEKLHRRLP